jgi:hypothetical protein
MKTKRFHSGLNRGAKKNSSWRRIGLTRVPLSTPSYHSTMRIGDTQAGFFLPLNPTGNLPTSSRPALLVYTQSILSLIPPNPLRSHANQNDNETKLRNEPRLSSPSCYHIQFRLAAIPCVTALENQMRHSDFNRSKHRDRLRRPHAPSFALGYPTSTRRGSCTSGGVIMSESRQ